MRFGAWIRLTDTWQEVLAEARHVEEAGWDGIWVADHFMPPRERLLEPVQESWTVLAALAVSTSQVRLGTLVTGNTYRHPAVLAKQAAQVDIMSGGRLILGLGSGWQENEHEAYDIPFYTVGGRLRRLEESVQIIRSLFENDTTSFEGRYYKIRNAPLAPKPVQARVPILVGGGGEQMTLRIVAKYADEWNAWGSPGTIKRKGEILSRYMEEIGRDPGSIKRTAQTIVAGSNEELRDILGQYRDIGLDEFILPPSYDKTATENMEMRERLMQEIAPEFR